MSTATLENSPRTPEPPAVGVPPLATGSAFLRDAIEKQLAKLRADCAVKREIKRNAFGRRWALAGGRGESTDKYWDDRQAAAQRESTEAVEAAERALVAFIAEHRPFMGADWIGNDHGRLCWAPFLGGLPIDQHYCQCAEGHEGNHCNAKGAWPHGVTNSYEWRAMLDKQNDTDQQRRAPGTNK